MDELILQAGCLTTGTISSIMDKYISIKLKVRRTCDRATRDYYDSLEGKDLNFKAHCLEAFKF